MSNATENVCPFNKISFTVSLLICIIIIVVVVVKQCLY